MPKKLIVKWREMQIIGMNPPTGLFVKKLAEKTHEIKVNLYDSVQQTDMGYTCTQ
jgi:hypothetical protein